VRRALAVGWLLLVVVAGFATLELVSRRLLGVWHQEVTHRHLQPYLMSGGYAPTDEMGPHVQVGVGGPDSYGYRYDGGTFVFDFDVETRAVADRGDFLFQDRVDLANDTAGRNGLRVFVVGGSAAYGIGASTPENRWFILLERHLREDLGEPVHVIPAAMIGHVSTQERIALELMVLPRRPDLVLILDGYNDAALPVTFGVRPGDPYDMGLLYANFYSALYGLRHWLAERSHLARVLVQGSVARAVVANEERLLASPEQLANYHASAASVYLDNTRHMLRRCAQEGIPCLSFLQPVRSLTRRSAGAGGTADAFAVPVYDRILEAPRDSLSESTLVDLTEVFTTPDWERFYVDEVHFNDAGHEAIASAIRPLATAALRDR